MFLLDNRTARIFVADLGMHIISLAEFHGISGEGLALHSLTQERVAGNEFYPEQLKNLLSLWRRKEQIREGERLNLSLPSQLLFIRFLQLPGAQFNDVRAIIEFEAQQNIPCALDAVVWDYQVVGSPINGTWNVVLIAIRKAFLSTLREKIKEAGFHPERIDAAPTALYNAFRFNYAEKNNCSLILEIGASTMNLIFAENEQIFIRTIPLDEYSIVRKQNVASAKKTNWQTDIREDIAEEPPPRGKSQTTLLNCPLLIRVHAEIVRSISFYCRHRSGSAPGRVLLCGEMAGLSHLRQTLQEKLHLPVDFFNPFRNIKGLEGVKTFKISLLGAIVGLATRSLENAPVEINLRCPKTIREDTLSSRKPYLAISGICMILALVSIWLYLVRLTAFKAAALQQKEGQVSMLHLRTQHVQKLRREYDQLKTNLIPLIEAVAERSFWPNLIHALEESLPSKFIWITRLEPTVGNEVLLPPPPELSKRRASLDPILPAQKANHLLIEGLYLENPQQATIVDHFVRNLSQNPLFVIADKAKVVRVRDTPDGQYWAYKYTLILPLNNLREL